MNPQTVFEQLDQLAEAGLDGVRHGNLLSKRARDELLACDWARDSGQRVYLTNAGADALAMAKAAAAREREAGHLLPDPEPEEKPENPLRLPWAKPAGTCIITADGGPTIHVREGTATPSTTLENRAALRDALYYAAKVHGPMRELLWDIEAWMCHHRPTDQFTDVSIAPWKALLDRITALLGTEEEG